MNELEPELSDRPAPPARKPAVIEEASVPVTVLATRGQAAVVQWFDADGREHRCTLPANAALGPTVPLATLARGIPYGVPWAKLIEITATAQDVEAALHGAGLWTFEDVQRSPGAVLGALQAAFAIDLGRILMAASEHGTKNKEA